MITFFSKHMQCLFNEHFKKQLRQKHENIDYSFRNQNLGAFVEQWSLLLSSYDRSVSYLQVDCIVIGEFYSSRVLWVD